MKFLPERDQADEMTALPEQDFGPIAVPHEKAGIVVGSEVLGLEEWAEDVEAKAGRHGLYIGGAWGLAMGVFIGLAVGMPLSWLIFFHWVN